MSVDSCDECLRFCEGRFCSEACRLKWLARNRPAPEARDDR